MFRDCFMNHRVVGYREDNVAAVARRGVVTCFQSKIEVPTQTPLSTVSSGRIWHTVDWWNDGLKRFAAPLMTQQWFTWCLMSCQQLWPTSSKWTGNSTVDARWSYPLHAAGKGLGAHHDLTITGHIVWRLMRKVVWLHMKNYGYSIHISPTHPFSTLSLCLLFSSQMS